MSTAKITTKKLLVAFDPSNPDARSSDFLAPINDSSGLFLFGLKSKKSHTQGMMVYLGKDITVNDVAAKLVRAKPTASGRATRRASERSGV